MWYWYVIYFWYLATSIEYSGILVSRDQWSVKKNQHCWNGNRTNLQKERVSLNFSPSDLRSYLYTDIKVQLNNGSMLSCVFFTQLSRNLKTVPVIQLTYLYQTCLSLACMSQNWTVTSYCLPVPSEVHQQKSFLICLGPLTDRREHTKVKWIKICHVYIPSLKARFLCSHYLCTSLNIFMLF